MLERDLEKLVISFLSEKKDTAEKTSYRNLQSVVVYIGPTSLLSTLSIKNISELSNSRGD
jgi:hypothetical protein